MYEKVETKDSLFDYIYPTSKEDTTATDFKKNIKSDQNKSNNLYMMMPDLCHFG